jgi:hypothetical protein
MVRMGWFELDRARRELFLYRDRLLELSQTSLDVSTRGYESGNVSFADVINSYTGWLDVNLASQRRNSDVGVARAELERRVGAPYRSNLRSSKHSVKELPSMVVFLRLNPLEAAALEPYRADIIVCLPVKGKFKQERTTPMLAKPIIITFATAVIGVALNAPATLIQNRTFLSILLGPATAHAEEALKAGMVDPKTGKKIKYWAAPMDPTYIRNEPGQSPMGMDLVPVYEEEGGEKEPSSTIRIDPVTRQNMGMRLGRVEKKFSFKTIRTFGTITYDETGVLGQHQIQRVDRNVVRGFSGGTGGKRGSRCSISTAPICSLPSRNTLSPFSSRKSVARKPRKGDDRLLDASRTRLAYWDLTDEQISHLEAAGEIQKTITIFSPASGVVIKKKRPERALRQGRRTPV